VLPRAAAAQYLERQRRLCRELGFGEWATMPREIRGTTGL
jgi:hypothetical protein